MQADSNVLYRGPFDTVFLVGSGADEGAWIPITNAINSVDPAAPVDEGSPIHANFWMAKFIALRRGVMALAKHKKNHGIAERIQEQHDLLRREICYELHDATREGTLRLRPGFKKVFSNPYWGTQKAVITTNWDLLLDNELPEVPIAYVHGNIDSPDSLYLPSDYAFDPAHSEETREAMYYEMDLAIRMLWLARRVCIFGLGMDPLDAELAAIVQTGLGSAEYLEEVRICNLATEEKTLRDRLSLLVQPDKAKIITFEVSPS